VLEAELTPGALLQPESLCQWEFPLTPSGIEPAKFRLVANFLNQLRHRVLLFSRLERRNLVESDSILLCSLRYAFGPYAELLEPTSHLVGYICAGYNTNKELKCYVFRVCLEFKYRRQRHFRRSQFNVCFIGVVQTFTKRVDLQLNICNFLMPWSPSVT
jgi:hypothetical protein